MDNLVGTDAIVAMLTNIAVCTKDLITGWKSGLAKMQINNHVVRITVLTRELSTLTATITCYVVKL